MSKIFGENGKSVTKLSLKEGAVIFLVETDEYTNGKFNSEQNNNLKKGFYKLSDDDVLAIHHNSDLFWSFIANNSGLRSEIHEIRKAVGLTKDEVKSKKIGDMIFLPSKTGLEEITIDTKAGVKGSVSNTKKRLQAIGLYSNYLGKNTNIRTITITSMKRTPHDQAFLVYNNAYKYSDVNHKKAMYKGTIGKIARENIKNGKGQLETIVELEAYIVAKIEYFNHVNNSENTMDIGAGEGRNTHNNSHFRQSFVKFQETNKYLNKNDSIEEGKKGEYLCYHAVFR